MSLIGLLVALVVIGVVLYIINSLIPMDPRIKMILNVVVCLFVLIWLLQVFVGFGDLGTNMRIR